ncbi:MAG: biotin transporter BioY [Calditrichota bacterium]
MFGGSLLIALSAQIRLPVPFSPVPVTGQTLGVIAVGILLGSKRGAGAVLAYLSEGIMGAPVFAGGACGAAYLLGPTGGYLIGFLPAAYLAGYLAERRGIANPILILSLFVIADAVIFTAGVGRLAMLMGIGKAISLGLYPFVWGELVKAAILVSVTLGVKAAMNRLVP